MRTLVAIPVYNEAEHLPRVLHEVRSYPVDLLVIDDGSTDATPDMLRQSDGVAVLRHRENRGYGQSLIDAFDYAARHGYDWVITMDCDEQHEPERIPDFLAAIDRGDADIISGSRYLRDFDSDNAPPVERRSINLTVNRLLRQILNLKLTDSFCGFKAHRVAALQLLSLDEPGYAFPLQFWPQCVRAGLRIVELPVPRIYRDRSRTFGGTLDDPAARLQHYLEVFLAELSRDYWPREARPTASDLKRNVCRCPQDD